MTEQLDLKVNQVQDQVVGVQEIYLRIREPGEINMGEHITINHRMHVRSKGILHKA